MNKERGNYGIHASKEERGTVAIDKDQEQDDDSIFKDTDGEEGFENEETLIITESSLFVAAHRHSVDSFLLEKEDLEKKVEEIVVDKELEKKNSEDSELDDENYWIFKDTYGEEKFEDKDTVDITESSLFVTAHRQSFSSFPLKREELIPAKDLEKTVEEVKNSENSVFDQFCGKRSD